MRCLRSLFVMSVALCSATTSIGADPVSAVDKKASNEMAPATKGPGDPATRVADTLEQRVAACSMCHGKQGEGLRRNEYFPRLAGKPAVYLYNQLLNYRDRRRTFPIMGYMVGFLSDAYLYEIAEYFSNLRPAFPPPSVRAKPEVLARGQRLVIDGDPARKLPACAACHGTLLTGLEPAIPSLVGLYSDYIAAQMGAWKNDKRHGMAPDCMHDVATLLTPDDIAAISAWLVSQPAPADARPAPAGSLTLPLECGGLVKK